METLKQNPTCAERVQAACNSRLDDLRVMLHPRRADVTLGDNGTLDTVVYIGDNIEMTFTDLADYRDEDGNFDLDSFFEDYEDDIREECRERFYEYGLAFDYVEPHTFNGQDEGYLRYQISCGGPSEEIRFYVSPFGERWGMTAYALHRAEFWYLDWFDGAKVDVTQHPTVRALFDEFHECGSVHSAIRNG